MEIISPKVSKRIIASDFLNLCGTLPLIDTRSPAEYMAGHIPGAINNYLFDNSQRESVGKTYKKSGRTEAVLEGLRLAGPELNVKLNMALKASSGKQLLVYCWRGGMRSDSMAWLFTQGGLEPFILEGGYKAYRNYVLGELAVKRKMLILGGMTGTGKTDILKILSERGEQTADLEQIASHRGSAFGSLGQGSQPTTEHFANLLYNVWRELDFSKEIWLEDESRNIGTVFLPELFWQNMHDSPVIAVISDIKTRVPRLVKDYSGFPREELIASVQRISKRLGGDRAADAIKAIHAGDFSKAAEITLSYYDKTYMYSLNRRDPSRIHVLKSETGDAERNAEMVLDYVREKGLLSGSGVNQQIYLIRTTKVIGSRD